MLKYFGIFKFLVVLLPLLAFAQEESSTITYQERDVVDKELNRVKFNYSNESSDLGLNLDLNQDDVNIVLKGKKVRDQLNFSVDSTKEKKSKNINQVVSHLRDAQNLFYEKRYQESLVVVKKAIAKKETAEGFALLGSIYFMLGQNQFASKSWKQALSISPNIPGVVEMLEYISIKAE